MRKRSFKSLSRRFRVLKTSKLSPIEPTPTHPKMKQRITEISFNLRRRRQIILALRFSCLLFRFFSDINGPLNIKLKINIYDFSVDKNKRSVVFPCILWQIRKKNRETYESVHIKYRYVKNVI